ncbi:hypothetical protein F4604DRAFT_1686400 [Suillus subluteus]|nr:hypothetical protein F4604DRAFT_1686400 [Suillus subluteus]
MVQLEQNKKKPRLQHSDLANSDLTPEEKQRVRQKRWLANEKRDPHRAQEIKEQNTANKWAWRKRKREEMQSKQLTPNTNSQGHAPQKRPRTSSPEAPSGHVGPSISEPDTIPIDPILLAQEALTTIVTPHPMRDIAVMTDTPSPPVNCSSIPDDQAYPSPTLSALTDLEFRNLANPIIGSQVHKQSDTVQWDDGSTTVLPCIMKNGINICEEDALAVSFFASLPESLPATSKNIVHLQHSDRRFTSRQLCDEISAALRINKAVVIRKVSTPEPATLDLEYLEDRGMSDLMRVVVHDAEQRTKDFTYPHQNATLAEFIHNIHDPNKIQCILDVPYGQGGLPSYLSTLDSGITNGWNQTTVDCPISDKVHLDNFIENWHGEIVTLLPGDMLIQPAGQFHAVYTPVASFATGGHFYNYECMHLTELSRYIDHKQGKILTNQVHAHSLEMFQRMVINLPRISRRVMPSPELYNRPLIALCTMVLECDKYVAAGTEKPKVRSSTTQPAHDIANAIIKHFWKDLKTATKTYRKKQTDGSNNQMHPGEPISREELLTCLKRFTTLGLYGCSDFGASSDLLDSCLFNVMVKQKMHDPLLRNSKQMLVANVSAVSKLNV